VEVVAVPGKMEQEHVVPVSSHNGGAVEVEEAAADKRKY